MIIDSKKYGGRCACGREHKMVTVGAVIESGCLDRFEELMAQYGITGKRCALYGENTYAATEGKHPSAEQVIILHSDGLHANEISTAEVLSRLEEDVEVIIAVGSGTIHDIARFCAHERNIRFVSCPTGASVDGFCSTVAAMTWHGYKMTMPAVAPEIVIADTDIISKAPKELVNSGVGDIMAKYIALADWKISHVLTDEYLCPVIYDLTMDAADSVMKSIPGIIAGDPEAYANVTYALIMSGIAMQLMGNSRPASGAEHHISHLIEMGPEKLTVHFPAMHGEKTGVGAVLAAEEYKRIGSIRDIHGLIKPYKPLDAAEITEFCGEKLKDGIIRENAEDCLSRLDPDILVERWPQVREIISGIPDSSVLFESLEKLGAKKTMSDIGVNEEDKQTIFRYSAMVRNRLTLMRIRRMLNI